MKAISIWQPFAGLLVRGFKIFETRTWAPPRSLIGKRIAIASTKTIKPEQRAYFEDEVFMDFYERTGLPTSISDLPHGYMLGTAILDSVELMTEEFMEEVSEEEKQYGWWNEGFYAWRMTDPTVFADPIPVRGAQGFYEWTPHLHVESQASQAPREGGAQIIRWDFRAPQRQGDLHRLSQAE